MNITMRQLKVFLAVTSHLSYTKAADELHLTQPAVSMQIKQLEDTLGLPLFEQLGKRIHITAAGQEMLHYSRAILRQLEEIGEVFTQLRGLEGGTLRLSAPSTANQFVAGFLAEFNRRYPLINYNFKIANRKGLLEQLDNNDSDLVIMGKPPETAELISERFMDNPLVLIAPPDHPLTKRKNIRLSEIMVNKFVVREPDSGTRIAMERFFREHSITLQFTMEMASNEAVKQAVAAGLGLGLASVHTLEMELNLKRLRILSAEYFPIMRHWYIVYRKGKRLAPASEAFKTFVLNEAKALWPFADNILLDGTP